MDEMTTHTHTVPTEGTPDYTSWATDSGLVLIPVEIAEQRKADQRRQLGINEDIAKLTRQIHLLAIALADATGRLNDFAAATPRWTPEEQDEIAALFGVTW
jgi:hypothetical protein